MDRAAEAEMAHPRIDVLRLSRRRAIAKAVARGAEMRTAFDDLARDAESRHRRVDSRFARVVLPTRGHAAGRRGRSPRSTCEPVAGTLPDVAGHVDPPDAAGGVAPHGE